ncbi:hypothetical protein PP938_gp018 [Rhizobium phage AF3]|uniref:Uncharacterized protein n=1 Tax=Rhizobium phage AF3 TaxID=2763529 RepID=A0A7G7WWI8_9CAUD|nr:hypothetical protein PP938_gp018 [Rhizobium phage AF3]QNH71582.1 hypothetical protein AF3_018 [Rhizobium phage AF3]
MIAWTFQILSIRCRRCHLSIRSITSRRRCPIPRAAAHRPIRPRVTTAARPLTVLRRAAALPIDLFLEKADA